GQARRLSLRASFSAQGQKIWGLRQTGSVRLYGGMDIQIWMCLTYFERLGVCKHTFYDCI
ncbi:MAG: hypothetical protein ACLRQ4_17845, partial [Neglectibacter timonensis]